MKLFIALKNDPANKKKQKRGFTLYSESGKVLTSGVAGVAKDDLKFSGYLTTINWALNRLKTLIDNRVLSDEDTITILINNKTIYNWLEKEKSPKEYVVKVSDIYTTLSYFNNPLEFIHSESTSSRVLFRDTSEDKGVKVTDLFSFQ
ncbi:hypothetical protein D3C71_1589970 [compost metagenome]